MIRSIERARPGRPVLAGAAAFLLIFGGVTVNAGRAAEAPEAQQQQLSALAVVTEWIAANTDLPAPGEVPQVVPVARSRLIEMRYGEGSQAAGLEALYDARSRTIFVTDGWTGSSPEEMSVLVHEMVHHLQAADGHRFACPEEGEAAAYAAQEAWLAGHGSSLEAAFGIDALTLLVRTNCMF